MDMQLFFNLFLAVAILVISSAQIHNLKDATDVKQLFFRIMLRTIQIWSAFAVPVILGIMVAQFTR